MIWQKLQDHGIDVGGKTSGHVRTRCPKCLSSRKPSNQRKKDLSVTFDADGEGAVAVCHHCDFKIGIRTHERTVNPKAKVEYRKPEYESSSGTLFDKAVKWFRDRGISEEVLKRNRIEYRKSFCSACEGEVGAICFPYFRNGEVVNVKYRDGKKHFHLETGAERILYGQDDIDTELIWVEGEIDKLSLEVAGFNSCVSVPNGAPPPNAQNLERHLDYLETAPIENVERHVIAVDADEPGVVLRRELVRRLGPELCWIVEWPEGCKDANDVLVKHGKEKLAACIRNARPSPIAGAVDPADVFDDLVALHNEGHQAGENPGSLALGECYTVKTGQWTLVQGIPSHGKSSFVDWLMFNLAFAHGWRFAVCSPENQPVEEHISKLCELYTGLPFGVGPNERMSLDQVAEATAWIQEHFTFIVPENDWSLENVFTIASQLVRRKGIKGLVLDPWNEFEHRRGVLREDEYLSQNLSKLRRFNQLHQIHSWLVVHPKNLDKDPKTGDYPVPTPYDCNGGAMWRNKADMAISIWRSLADETRPVEIHVQKVRFKRCGKIGVVKLWYDKLTNRYSDDQHIFPVHWQAQHNEIREAM